MRTRNAGNPKPTTAAKRTPPARKSSGKANPTVTEPPSAGSASTTPKSAETRRAAKAKQVKSDDPATNISPASNPARAVEEANPLGDEIEVTPEAKVVSGSKTVRRVVRRTVVRRKTPSSTKTGSTKTPKLAEVKEMEVEESGDNANVAEVKEMEVEESGDYAKVGDANETGSVEKEETSIAVVEESTKKEKQEEKDVEPLTKDDPNPMVVEEHAKIERVDHMEDVKSVEEEEPNLAVGEVSPKKMGSEKDVESEKKESARESSTSDKLAVYGDELFAKNVIDAADIEETKKHVEAASDVRPPIGKVESSLEREDPLIDQVSRNMQTSVENEKEGVEEEKEVTKVTEDDPVPENGPLNADEAVNEGSKGDDVPQEDLCLDEEKMDEDIGDEDYEDLSKEELAEDDMAEHGSTGVMLEEVNEELTAIATERKIRKEVEIFVGGLDRDATEDEVKKAFENVGEVVQVRMLKDPLTNKNKGYAFVRFAKKEQATRALSEMKNPVIHRKRCGTAPSEDNDTLFLGNICNTWTKEAILQKLKDYGVHTVESITLVADPQREGLSRGFAFLEFSCHSDAMLAFKRLQKPDAIFGHPERTAKVAFSEPLREPDPEVLAQVKSVFVDGLPSHWDDGAVREHFKEYGEIERIMLARNMSTAKRRDFGFVDFTTHEAATACIDSINNKEFGDGNSKTRVRARLSNPLPKIQAVKGGMAGGFRIGHGSGRGFERGGRLSGRVNSQRGRGSYLQAHRFPGRMGSGGQEMVSPFPSFRGRQQYYGQGRGRWESFRGNHYPSGRGYAPARFNLDRQRKGPPVDRNRGRHFPIREPPFYPEEEFPARPFVGRHHDDSYYYDVNARDYDVNPRGIKRPYFAEQDPDYMEPSRGRSRLHYSDPATSFPGTRYQGYQGPGTGDYPHNYYGDDYHGSSSSSTFYGGDRPYGDRPYGDRYQY